ncbi:polysaccharide deacetylase family protein [Bacillus sp. Xin]|uniref:polysaccharide deacetylase family protein n=1 Tax=unclassified Bacillus (in: firmicutes) TaxID=185979 RepID=UPI001574B8E6|nr:MULTISPECIES: polysaccharide deacetylase family protein [unclassified Bacillus (in: firmicutes)]MBC6974743.1 polysaccharide deacetylase family protein [Bacillus sp. Xin]NSW37153.1 polysaccharide deacetylase family protein [Bacillus sp. Xin1]
MKKRIIISLIILTVLFILLFGAYKLMNSRTYQLFGELTNRVETNQKVVALTFDDGPTKNVEEILPLLNKYNAKATFFVIGNELEKNLKLGRAIVKSGHQLGNHTYSHNRMIFKTPSFIKVEVKKTNTFIHATGYTGQIDFRPPNGKKLIGLPYYLNKHHIETITWDLEPDTYYTSPSDKINYVNKNVKPGSIILLHSMYDDSEKYLQTLEGILDSLSKKGYQFVTVNELQKR